jgi:Big-like domain-containing protein
MSLRRQRGLWFGIAVIMVIVGGLLTAGAGPAASAAPQLSAARAIPGLNTLNAGGNARVNSVSCGSPGNCAAVGAYTGADGNLLPFVADEKNGTWGNAQALDFATLSNKPKAEALSVSCASAGNCSAVGYITPAGVVAAFTADEKNGTWGRATLIPGINGQESEAGSVSCPTAGNCAADGFVLTGGALEPFTVAQANGTWGTAAVVPGITSLNVGQNAGATSISCAAPGSCAAAGTYIDAHGDVPSWISSTNGQGAWNPARPEPGTSGGGLLEIGAPPQITVSCGASGNCAAAGWTDTNATRTRTSFVLNEVNSAWGAPRDVPGLAALTGTSGFSRITAVSCRSAGNCTVTGQFSTSLRGTKAFVVSEVNGTWGNAIEVPGITAISGGSDAATASAVSCATAGNCAAGGVYDDSNPTPAEHVFVAVQAGGAWGNAQQLTGTGTKPALSSVSCATPGNCAFGGSGTDASGHVQGFVADLSAAAGAGGQIQTTTSLALSAPTVTFGQEQAGQISVTVTAASGGAPRGVVTVTANKATVCLIVLGSGTGSCRLTPKGLRPGRYALTARFFGGLGFAGSASVPAALTVTR